MAWSFANFTAVATMTSASIVAVQSPAKTFLVNLTKNGTAMPVYSGGVFGFVRTLYTGTGASLSGSVLRTTYVTNTKNNKPVEVMSEEMVKEEGKITKGKMGYVLAAAAGDVAITQIPESLSTLRKVDGLLPKNFKWYLPYNIYHLGSGGLGAKYGSAGANFMFLCVGEEYFAKKIDLKDKKINHLVAGGLSGASAAVFAYPFTVLKDLTLVKASVSPEGQVSIPSTSTVMKGMVKDFKEAPMQVAKTVVTNSAKQLAVRAPLTATIFGIISFVGECLGPEPLREVVPERFQPSTAKNPHGFFGSSPRVETVEEDPVKEATSTSTTTPGSK